MKQRILVAAVGIPALLGVLCFAPDWATMALIMGLCYYFSKNKGNQKFGKVVVGLLVLGVLLALLGLV